MAIDVDALVKQAQEYYESVGPTDVEVLLGDQVVTVRLPYLMPAAFSELAAKHPPHVGGAVTGWFDGDQVVRNYPDVVLIVDGEEDDLLVIRERAAHYRWPEVWDALDGESRDSLRATVWGLYVYEPQKKLKEAQHG